MKLYFLVIFCITVSMFSEATSLEQSPEAKTKQPLPKASAFDESENHMVHIGVFYTQDLLDIMNVEEISEYVDRQIDASNLVLENSGLAIRRKAIYIGEFPSPNQPDLAINSFLFTLLDEQNQPVRDLAEQYGFDYITVLRPHVGFSYCGWALYDSPYTVMEIGGNCTSATLGAHEWGHNDGADHDIANSSDIPLREYGRGYNCGGEGTIMSTSNNWFNRHNFYSSPEESIGGDACGKDGEADVVRMLNEVKELPNHLGNRHDLPPKTVFVNFKPLSNTSITEGDSLQLQLAMVDSEGLATIADTKVSVQVYSKATTALASSDYQPVMANIVFNIGESEKTIEIQTNADQVQENTESFNVGLRYGDITHTQEELIQIDIEDNGNALSYELSSNSVKTSENESITLSINRSGNTDIESNISLLPSHNWIILSTNEVHFSVGQTIAEVSILIGSANDDKSGSIIFSDSAGKVLPINLNIEVSKEPKKKDSSGGVMSFYFLVLTFLCIFIKTKPLKQVNRKEFFR